MRLLKIILAGLFAAFAVLVALFIGAVALTTSIVRSFFKPSRPQQASGQTGEARPTKMRDLDVIDVTATEVPADPPESRPDAKAISP